MKIMQKAEKKGADSRKEKKVERRNNAASPFYRKECISIVRYFERLRINIPSTDIEAKRMPMVDGSGME